MKTTKKTFCFADLPRDYAALCRLHLPRPIHDKIEYVNTLEIARAFAGFEERMTADQNDYFELLTSLLEDWEAEHDEWRGAEPLQLLRHLLEEHDLNATALSRLLGGSRALGALILRGERAITAAHARTLGAYFGLPAGVFV